MDSASIVTLSTVITALATGVMIWAVYVAPRKAFEAQWKLQLQHDARQRRVTVFRTLLATRGNVLNPNHVEALNLIDVEFPDESERQVRDAWKMYLDHLNTRLPDETAEPNDAKRKDIHEKHEGRRKDLLAELLQKMGARLGYNFDFTYLKDRAYYPEGHETLVQEQGSLRRGLIEVLWNGRPLIIRSLEPPAQIPEQNNAAMTSQGHRITGRPRDSLTQSSQPQPQGSPRS